MRTAAAIFAGVGLALLAAACGGSPSASGSAGSAQQSRAVTYARCMRSNGVSNWPDPSSSGVFDKSKLTTQQLGVSSSQLQTAQGACRHLLPNAGQPPNQAQLQQIKVQAMSFARCVRTHGVPNFPDPDSTGRVPDPATVGIDQGSPSFRGANQACARYRPPYIPSNAAYSSWARSHPGSG